MVDWQVLARGYLCRAIKMSQFNPAGSEHDAFGPSTKRSQLPLWSHLIDLFWLYGSIKVLIMQILQHKYNELVRDLERMDSAGGGAGGLRQQKLAELAVAIGRIEMIGNPIYKLGRVVEILLVGVLIIAYLGKKQLLVYNRLRGPVRIGVVQMLLDPRRELEHTTGRQIGHLADKYYESLGNYWHNRRELISAPDQDLQRPGSSGGATRQVAGPTTAITHEIPWAHERAMNVMRNLVVGQLVPPNRTSAWARQSAKLYCGLLMSAWLLAALVLFILLVIVPYSGLIELRYHAGLGAIFSQVELYIFVVLTAHWIIFPFNLTLIIAGDQMKFERELRKIIEQLIEDLDCRYYDKCARGSTRLEMPMRRELEHRLLRVLTLYKLFKQQLRAAQPTVGFIGAHIAFLMLFLPIMGRLYGAHMTREERLLLMAAGLVMISGCDFIVLPNCVIQARCLRLFGRMTQLLVHIDGLIAYEACNNGQRAQQVCDVHMVGMLRKEVRSPEMAVRSFTTRALFLRLTYASWLGIHFWCGLLLAPLLMSDTARLGSVGVPLVESLGLF